MNVLKNKKNINLMLLFQPPIIPKVAHEGDTKNFDTYPEDEWQKTAAAGEKDIALFVDF
jgi:protein kinase X